MKFIKKEIEEFNGLLKSARDYSIHYKRWAEKESERVLNPEYDLEKSMQCYQQALDLFVLKYGKFREYIDELEEYDVYAIILSKMAYIYAEKSYENFNLQKAEELCQEIIKVDDSRKISHGPDEEGIFSAYLLLGQIYSNKENEKYGIKVDGEKAIDYFKHSSPDGYFYISQMYLDGTLVEKDEEKAREYCEYSAEVADDDAYFDELFDDD